MVFERAVLRGDRFNPRPRTGGDTAAISFSLSSTMFQSAPPHGGRPSDGRIPMRRCCVSIRAPARGATISWYSSGLSGKRFNPRPRTGGDPTIPLVLPLATVSIRAPARGATLIVRLADRDCRVFQSAPPHGGRPRSWSWTRSRTLFQSAPPHGGRPRGSRFRSRKLCFNPRPRTGGDFVCLEWWVCSTPGFNPRPRTGGNSGLRLIDGDVTMFQSAPPHGGRPVIRSLAMSEDVLFQSAPPHGGRPPVVNRRLWAVQVSIRAPARGATSGGERRTRKTVFQSAPPHGGRPSVYLKRVGVDRVSIRAPARGATGALFRSARRGVRVSIRAPARGATRGVLVVLVDE